MRDQFNEHPFLTRTQKKPFKILFCFENVRGERDLMQLYTKYMQTDCDVIICRTSEIIDNKSSQSDNKIQKIYISDRFTVWCRVNDNDIIHGNNYGYNFLLFKSAHRQELFAIFWNDDDDDDQRIEPIPPLTLLTEHYPDFTSQILNYIPIRIMFDKDARKVSYDVPHKEKFDTTETTHLHNILSKQSKKLLDVLTYELTVY